MEKYLLNYILTNLDINCLVYNSSGDIVYPFEKTENVSRIEKILEFREENSNIICIDEQEWYVYKENFIEIDNNYYRAIVLQDITEYKMEQLMLEVDETTKILTKRAFFNRMDEYLESALINNACFSVVIGDIDYFKNFNDKYGHLVGDLILGNIGQLFKNNIDENSGILGRFGGEEFIILLKNISEADSFEKIEEIRNKLSKLEHRFNNCCVSNITMSFGIYNVSCSDLKGEDILKLRRNLIKFADEALYQSKNEGRNKTVIYTKRKC